jgi:transposase
MRLVGLYPLKGFMLTEIFRSSSGKVLLKAVGSSNSAICPYCQTLSKKRHSVYIRKPQALPCSSTPIQLILSVQRYLCENPACRHKTFAERIPDTVHFYSRRTIDLEALLQIMAFEMSAESVGRVGAGLQVSVSPDSVLRLIRKGDIPREPEVRVLGVDDWASKKGQNYGSLLVDLEKHQAIELLPDRTQNTLCAWLQNHPEIEIVTRDRSFEYKAGIDLGAPQAIQVVDRWHLLHNLQEKLQEIISSQLRSRKSDNREHRETPTQPKRKEHFRLVRYLSAKGYSQRLIARTLGISRQTVRRYLEMSDLPDWQRQNHAPSRLDPYQDYLRQRWRQGCQDTSLLWKELKQKGYPGQRKSVAEYLERFRKPSPHHSARQLAWWFMKDRKRLQDEARTQLKALFAENQKLEEIYWLTQAFRSMLSSHAPELLDAWLVKMETCEVKKLQNFAFGLRQDYDAVKAALSSEWSNGQVEGQVNRLKSIKHQMYGRANFDLLRQRVLGPPS